MLPEHARYLDEVSAPSVIALNSLAAGEAVNHFMLAVTNLHTDDDEHSFLHVPRFITPQIWLKLEPVGFEGCCGGERSVRL